MPDRKQEKDEHVLVKLTGKAKAVDEESVEDEQEESKSQKS